jgi:hypothetical protein
MSADTSEKKEKYVYYVDGKKYESQDRSLTGAQIKSKLPSPNNTYQLFLEDRDKDSEDKQIADTQTVDLKPGSDADHDNDQDKGIRHFYTVPPATFGLK